MKFAYKFVFVLAAATFCTIPAVAQQPDTPTPQPQQPEASQPQQQPDAQQGQAAPNAPAAIQLSPVTGELTNKLDSKTAKAGDSVVLKTTANTSLPDGTVIPKGSKIMGHVTEAQAHGATSQEANGRVTLQFDQAQLKSGQSLPIMSSLQSVAPASGASDAGSSALPMAGAPSSASPAGGASAGSTSGSTTSRQSSTPASPSAVPSAGGDQGGPAPGTTVARNGNVVIRTTSVPGVLVAASASGRPFSNASGALMSAQQDVRLDGGTKVMLEVASASGIGNSR